MHRLNRFVIALLALIPVTALAADEAMPSKAMLQSPLEASFRECHSKDAYFRPRDRFALWNKKLMTECMARHRIISALAEDKGLNTHTFVCSAAIRLRSGSAPFAKIDVISTKCDVAGKKLVDKLFKLLSGIHFDPLEPEIGEWIRTDVTLRSLPATDSELANSPSGVTSFRQRGMEYIITSQGNSFANAGNLPPPLPPPGPNCTNCGRGDMSMNKKSMSPAERQGTNSTLSGFWTQSVATRVSAAINNDKALSEKLNKGPYSFGVKLYFAGHQITTADIMQASGTAKKLGPQIRSVVLGTKLGNPPTEGDRVATRYGNITFLISRK